jgi:hypothetical protein
MQSRRRRSGGVRGIELEAGWGKRQAWQLAWRKA